MTKKVWVDATLNFGLEDHLSRHKVQFGSKLVFDMKIPLLYTVTIFIGLFSLRGIGTWQSVANC